MIDPANYPNAIAYAFAAVGGIGAAAKVCGRSYQALSKWRSTSSLPRTEYTGETRYAFLLAEAGQLAGNDFDAQWLLEQASPIRSAN